MRSLLLAILPLTLAACAATPRPTTPPPMPMPGYKCDIDVRGDFGVITANLEIDIARKFASGYIHWDAGNGAFANPWITATFFRGEDGRFSVDSGTVNILRHISRNRPGRPPSTLELSLELTTAPDAARILGGARFASSYERSAGPFYITVPWSDIAALARGAPHLYLVARDRKRALIDQNELDRTIFDRAVPHISASMARLDTMLADPARHCTHVDDLIERDIVVT